MIVLGTISWVLLLGNGLLPLTTAAHVCTTTATATATATTTATTTNTVTSAAIPSTMGQTTSQATTTGSSTPVTTDAPMQTTKTMSKRKSGESYRDLCVGVVSDTFWCDPQGNGETFIRCLGGTVFLYKCQQGLRFNKEKDYCDWPQNIVEKCVAGEVSIKKAPTSPAPTATTTTTTTLAPYPTGSCKSSNCQLPDCRCLGTDIPGNLPLSDVPQMILLTFDDGINRHNIDYYDLLFPEDEKKALKNPNQCRTAATFFVSNDYNDMTMVKKLWSRDNEMASHSLTHSSPSGWNSDKWKQEMQGMRAELARELGVKVSRIHGMRVPYLDLGGETQFSMMQYNHITYDSSMFGGSLNGNNTDHPVWPFSLHYPPTKAVCVLPRCPMRSYPGVWEVPIIRQYNLVGEPCSMTDSCRLPDDASADDVTAYLRHNFQRHYTTNRAPFILSLHATWFNNVPESFQGLRAFLSETNADPNVWQVTMTQMLDWVRHPVPRDRVTELDSWKMCV